MTAFSPLPGAVSLSGTSLMTGAPVGTAGPEQPGLIGRAIAKVKSIFGGGLGSGGSDAMLAQQMLAQQAALPANATQLPNATVYSYDAAGNPAVAGLAGLSPQMQQQFGITPQMVSGMTQGVDPSTSGAQLNATNQTNVGGLGVGGMGMGTAVPVLGQPILNVPDPTLEQDDAATKPPHEAASGSSQVVRNSNSTEREQQGIGGWDSWGGMATPYSPYGSSMTGAYVGQQTGVRGFFSRLLGG